MQLRATQLVKADLSKDVLTQSSLLTHTWTLPPSPGGGRGGGVSVSASAAAAQQQAVKTWRECVPLTVADTFDVVSCQFAMHYMFARQES